MYLKSIELVGFKSFVGPTSLNFEPGISIIVGPNGCGKSNVSDAIRWVLGEQSAKLLRGRRMEDLIFNGSASRKPLGMAEVSLVLGDAASTLGESPYAAFDEVKVTRRLYRDDTSEYRLNGTPCRLRDIVELFLESGLATNAFTVIEQGRVAAIVSSKPEDRRLLIEQAAGVLRYKHKRAIAQRRLEAARDNLLRVNDIVEELGTQLERLRRQAQRARRWQALSQELRGVELSILAEDFFATQARGGSMAEEAERVKAEAAGLAARLSAQSADLARLKLDGVTLERVLATRRKDRLDCEGAIDRAEHRLSVLKGELERLADDEEATRSKVESLGAGVGLEAERLAGLEQKGRELEDAYGQAWALHEAREAEAAQAARSLAEAEGAVDEAKAALLERMQAVARLSNEGAGLETRRSLLEARRDQLSSASEADRAEQERIGAALELHASARQSLAAELEEAIRQRAVNANETSRTAEAVHSVEDEIKVVQQTMTEKRSLLGSLESIQRSFEGYKEGVRYLMERRRESGGLEGIRGVVAEVVECPQAYEVAIEAALGDRVQSLVVESHSDVRSAIERLRSESAGRSAFIPLEPKGHSRSNGVEPMDGLIGPASDVVSCRDEFRHVVEHLLDGVWLVEDFDAAMNVWSSNGHQATLVTLDGIVLEPSGLVVGGSANDGHLELLKKRRLLKDLAEEVTRLRKKLDPLEAERASLTQRKKSLEENRSRLDARVADMDKRLVEVDKTLEHLTQDGERVARTLEVAAAETGRIELELAELASRAEELADRRLKADSDRQGQEDLIAQAERAASEASGSWEALREAVHLQSLAVAGLRGGRDAHRAELKAAAQRLQDLSDRLAEGEAHLRGLVERESEIRSSLQGLEEELKARYGERVELMERLKVAEEEMASHQEEVSQLEASIQRSREVLDEAKERLAAMEVARAEVRVELSHIEDRVRREWRLATPALVAYHEPDGPPIEERRRRADELGQRLRNLGGVNLEALQEFEEVEARHTFLSTQKADLEGSIDDLKTAIERINRTSRRMMRETFDAVNAHFQQVFSRLFDGGSAELYLTDDDILEAGVDISVQPPGKRLGSITLLSAGEKALTALALLFSMFLVKPAPFCLLDEVDASLDDANIQRFSTLIRELAEETQFIVVTHNKQTMVNGQVLYGVTMQEEGVSRVVSLDLKQAEAHAH